MLKYGRRSKIKSAMESWKGDLSIYAKNDYYTHINWLVQICRRQFYDICKNFTPGANSTGALKSLTTFFTFAGSVNMSSIYTDFDFLPLPTTPQQQKKVFCGVHLALELVQYQVFTFWSYEPSI